MVFASESLLLLRVLYGVDFGVDELRSDLFGLVVQVLEYLALSGRFVLLVLAEALFLSVDVEEAVSIVAAVTQGKRFFQVFFLLHWCYLSTAFLVDRLSLLCLRRSCA